MPNIRVMHFGLGPIGAAILKRVSNRPGLKVVSGIDMDPAKIGRDLSDVAGLAGRLGLKVSGDAARNSQVCQADVVVLCTSSSIKILPQLETILKSKTPIVSTNGPPIRLSRTSGARGKSIRGRKGEVAVPAPA
jgi:4-hydroxy-tetrahydrodipicolinate reductase